MATYTTQIKSICEHFAKEKGETSNKPDAIIASARAEIFDFDYPIHNEDYKPVLETKILRHFYTREIGLETFELWRLFLNDRLNMIMPYYVQMYKSAELQFDPFIDTTFEMKHDGTGQTNKDVSNSSVQNATGETSGRTVGSQETKDTGSSETTTNEIGSSTSQTDASGSTKSEGSTSGTSSETGKTTSKSETSGTGKETVDETHNGHEHFSDTPQGNLADVENGEYLTNATYKKDAHESEVNKTEGSTNEGEGTSESNGTTSGTSKDEGSHTDTSKTDASGSSTGTSKTDNVDVTHGDMQQETSGTSKNDTSTQSQGAEEVKTVDAYLDRVVGKRNGMTYSEMLLKLRETFINIDASIINDLRDLFMTVY